MNTSLGAERLGTQSYHTAGGDRKFQDSEVQMILYSLEGAKQCDLSHPRHSCHFSSIISDSTIEIQPCPQWDSPHGPAQSAGEPLTGPGLVVR